MTAGTTIKLECGQDLRSHPGQIYEVDGFGPCAAEEILVGDFIRFGKKLGKVVSAVTWRVPHFCEEGRYGNLH